MMKIYLSPSDQTENPYAWGNTNEGDVCNEIARYAEVAFKRCGFDVKRNNTYSISEAIFESNSWGADYHLCIHTNASNGTVAGTRLFYGDPDGGGYQACLKIMGTLSPITPGTSDNITQRSTLNEVRSVAAYTVYIEVGFHDNKEEAKWMVEHTQLIAEKICEGMCHHCGMEYVPLNPAQGLYRVQVGAFANRDNAVRLKEQLIALGYTDAFIV